jgi:hypothetical protein
MIGGDRDGFQFKSKILPPCARRLPKVSEVLPMLYLCGISTKDFVPALGEFFGSEAGLSASTVQRLTVPPPRRPMRASRARRSLPQS